MAEGTDLIMNSKREITGNRIIRKKVSMNGEDIEILSGDISKLESKERKLLADLEEEREEYYDRDLWERIIAGGKRKAEGSIKEESKQVTEDDIDS